MHWKKSKIIIRLGIALPFIFYLWSVFQVLSYSSNLPVVHADVAIVLGAGTHAGKLSPVYRERMNHAIQLHQEGKVHAIICTGGLGANEDCSDARAACHYAQNCGVPPEFLMIEDRSTITKENLLYAHEIALHHGWKNMVVVSDPLHMKRAMFICEHHNIQAIPSATKTSMYRSWKTKGTSLLYEAFFLSLDKMLYLTSAFRNEVI